MSELSIESVEGKVSAEEMQMRIDLAAAYRLIALNGWDDLVFTHITARVPNSDHHFLINPYGLLFEEITASSLVKIDVNGNKVMDSPFPVNPAGFTIHSAIHGAREDATCVMHTHTLNGVAVSIQKSGLQPLSQHSLFPLSGLSYHDYEGVALNEDEKPRLVSDLGMNNFMILKNHGLLTCANSVADTYLAMYFLEVSCQIQMRAQTGGGDLSRVPNKVLATAKEQAEGVTLGLGGQLIWPALLRRLNRIDSSYRT